jgi:hypothetical protein
MRIDGAFENCSNLSTIVLTSQTSIPTFYSYSNPFYGINKNCVLIVPPTQYSQIAANTQWTNSFKTILPSEGELIIDNTKNEYHLDFNSEPQNFTITGYNLTEDFDVTTVSSNPDVVTVNYTKENMSEFQDNINFTISQNGIVGESEITLTITSNEYVYTKTINVDVVEEIPVSWSVEAVEGAQYGFELNDNRYYESKNKGIHNSYALCKLNIVNPAGLNVYLDCINSGESSCDYGLISKPDTPLALSYSTDDSSKLLHSFSGSSSTNVQTVNCGAIEGTIYIKYRKDYSANSGNDSLQFSVRIE